MKMIVKRLFILLIVLFIGNMDRALAQGTGHFRVIGGVPHLPVVDPGSVTGLAAGMMILHNTTKTPLIYSGSAWESLCSTSSDSGQPVSTFTTVAGIPSMPVLSADPAGVSPIGAVYYSTADQRIMIYSGASWMKLSDIRSSSVTLPVSSGFETSSTLKISRIPVLDSDPNPTGLSEGAFYFSSVTKSIRYYANNLWHDLNCSPIETIDPSGVTNSSFTSGVRILSDGLSFDEVGICWSKSSDPVSTLPTKLAYVGIIPNVGELPLTVTNNLDASTLYYVRAYAKLQGSGEVIYGENKSFTMDVASLATIITLPEDASQKTAIVSVAGGNITRDGGARISERGVIYSEVVNGVEIDPELDPRAIKTRDGSGAGSFPSKMTPLKANTTYLARAYAVNIKGPAYGLPILTIKTPPPTAPVLSPSITISDITDVSAATRVTILNNGGAEVRHRGVSWSKVRIDPQDWKLDNPNIDYERSQTVSAFDVGTFDCQLLRLQAGERYYVRTYATNDIGTSFSSETAFDATGLPTVNTLPLDEQATTGVEATGEGVVISTGASPLLERGFVWSKDQGFDPTSDDRTKVMKTTLPVDASMSGTGLFYGLKEQLEPATTYYYRAYAKNSFGPKYGEELEFTTAGKPTVTTDPLLSQITATSAVGGGNVTNSGGEPVTYKGLSWNQDPINSEPNQYVLAGSGTGSFFSTITGLRANTTYYVRAFGTNSVGPGYGDPVELKTGDPVSATIHTYQIDNTSGTSVPAGGYILNDGGSDVRERGFCWNTSGAPTVNHNKVSGGTGTGRFDLIIGGLQPEKIYYVRAYAITGAPEPSYGNIVSFKTVAKPTVVTKTNVTVSGTTADVSGQIMSDGGSLVAASGILWSLQNDPEIGVPTKIQSGKGSGEFTHTIKELLGNSTYYYRAFATNGVGVGYGRSETLNTPPPVKPTIKTLSITGITGTTGKGGGQVISHGGALLVETGLVWSTSQSALPENVLNDRTRQNDPGSFTSVMTGLDPGKKYYVWAYAKNAAGLIAYGDRVEFTTWNYATVETGTVLSITNVSAIGQGKVVTNGGTPVTRNGLVWAEHEEPTLDDFVSSPAGSGTGSFTANLTNLYGNKIYYVRAYAINSAGVSYGPEKVFFTTLAPVAPTLETKRPESTSLTTALAGGVIMSHGGGPVTTRGVVWGETKDFDYRSPKGVFEQTGYGEGSFSIEMTGLTPGKKYYVRAFADNGTFKGYGPEVEFIQADYPALTTRPASAKTNKTITTGGVILSTGHAPLLHTGVVWSTDQFFDPKDEHLNRIVQEDPGNFITTITGLKGGNEYYVYAFAENVAGIAYGQLEKITTLAAGYAEVVTTDASDVTGTTAKTGGIITDDGGSDIISRGVAFTEERDIAPENIPAANHIKQSGSATGPFITYLSGLKENTDYYIRAFAENAIGMTYGGQKQFRTQGRPIVTVVRASTPIATRAGTSVVIDARIDDDGRARMLGHGIVWDLGSGPTLDLETRVAYNGGQVGGYQVVVDGLLPAREYFVRAYGINTVGLNYGNNEFRFETPPIAPAVLSVSSVIAAGETTATAVAEITDNGGSWVSERGIIWSLDPGFDPRAATEAQKIRLGEDIGRFEGALTGLEPGETYYVWAYAINRADTKYSDKFTYPHPAVLPKVTTNPLVATLSTSSARGAGTVDDTGGSAILKTGLAWSTKWNFDPKTDPFVRTEDGELTGDLTGGFTGIMTGLVERTTYYVRAYAENGKGTAYGEPVSFCLFATSPELTTISVQDILGRSANVSGSLDRDGGMPVTRWGFVWSTDMEPDYYKHPHTEIIRGDNDPVFAGGNFGGVMTNLLPNTQYYVRAYAINLAGVGYGTPKDFLTADYPTLTAAQVDQAGTTTTTIKGNITHNGRLPILKRGIVWGLYDDPERNPLGRVEEDVAPGGAVEGHGEGEFMLQMTGLEPETNYFAKAYAINEVGTTHSTYVRVTTNPITSPAVTTIPADNVTPTSANPGGNVTDNGGAEVTMQGILYRTDDTEELIFDNSLKTINNGAPLFIADLNRLEPGTKYYYRAYAYNGYKYGYGEKKDFTTPAVPPTVGEVTISDIQSTNVKATAAMTHHGGDPVAERGFVWTSQDTDPTISNKEGFIYDGIPDVGTFSQTISPLQEGVVYRIRAYARNGVDYGYGPVKTFTICPPTITRYHAAGHNGAAETKEVIYEVVSSELSGEMKCWIGRNLGASEKQTSVSDSRPESAGWYWQFNRSQGHMGAPPSIAAIDENQQWLSENDPCRLLLGEGWRLPSAAEYANAKTFLTNMSLAYASDLKLHAAGYAYNGSRRSPGAGGYYWSSTSLSNSNGSELYFDASQTLSYARAKNNGNTIRCLQDAVIKTLPSVSKVVLTNNTGDKATATSIVTLDGGSDITDRGFIINLTSAFPDLDNNLNVETVVRPSDRDGAGLFSELLTGLQQNKTYYLWAFAKNSEGFGYSKVERIIVCPPTITRYHAAGHNGAAETKEVKYEVVSSMLSGELRCWIGRNLGATEKQNAVSDSRPEAAGWYWQFNRLQAYVDAPPSIAAINENQQWLSENDPCRLLLGEGWRLPSAAEYANAKTFLTNMSLAYASDLKLHAAGYAYNGGRRSPGAGGYYWSSTSLSNSNANEFYFDASQTLIYSWPKNNGNTIRCLQDAVVETLPSISKVVLTNNTGDKATATSIITLDGGSDITDRGFIINLTNAIPDLDKDLNVETIVRPSDRNGAGLFSELLTGLQQNKTYYLWAFAKNNKGYGYSKVEKIIVCPPTITRYHAAGHNGAAETKEVEYKVVNSKASGEEKCWIGQNLGASKQASGVSDVSPDAAGWYWQFNRPQGYVLSPGAFTISEDSQWLQQNDPCALLLGAGWRMPTSAEWTSVRSTWKSSNDEPFTASGLSLHAAGYSYNSTVQLRGSTAYYWSSDQSTTTSGTALYFAGTAFSTPAFAKYFGSSVRCLMEDVVSTKASVSKPTFSNVTTNSTTATAVITLDGGSHISDRGFIWNTSGLKPDLENNLNAEHVINPAVRTGAGLFSEALSGLDETKHYYIWAYVKNDEGFSYSDRAEFILCPSSFDVQHLAGHNGAPETIKITYHSVYSAASGKPACWLTQDLGAAFEPTGATDKTQNAMGWFWQYNNKQAYKYTIADSKTTPGAYLGSTAGATWSEADDPCRLLIGAGWRMPTAAEWTAADAAPKNWSTVTDAYDSGLKLHSPGFLSTSRVLTESGTRTGYWTNASGTWVQLGTGVNSAAVHTGVSNAHGFLMRCLREAIDITPPSVTAVVVSDMTPTEAKITATVVLDGGDQLEERGIVWNTTGDPTVESNTGIVREAANATGEFSSMATGLKEGYYYIRAWARNGSKLGYGSVERVLICPPSMNRYHLKGISGAPEDKEVEYKIIGVTVGAQSNCWIAQNLGASVQPVSEYDANPEAAGWYWQFNRGAGYISGTPAVWNRVFEKAHWASPDPCNALLGGGWRLPTSSEWTAVNSKWMTQAAVFGSGLKVHSAGWYSSNGVNELGQTTRYWSSTSGLTGNGELDYYTGMNFTGNAVVKLDKTFGAPIRCLLGSGAPTLAAVNKLSVSGSSGTGFKAKVIVMHDGGSKILKRGFVWATTNNPTLGSNLGFTEEKAGVGEYIHNLNGLQEGVLYYVKAYVTNDVGTVYSTYETVIGCPSEFTRYHVVGNGGAAVTKKVDYKVTTSSLSGTSQCWITQNLGADKVASNALDTDPAAAGWYWQFSRQQAYEFNSSRVPVTGWDGYGINEPGGFYAKAQDPCAVLLGVGWRMPTSAEWTAIASKWNNLEDGFNSELKMHASGWISSTAVNDRGTFAKSWSSNPAPGGSQGSYTYGAIFHGSATQSAISSLPKSVGATIRCLATAVQKTVPSVTVATVVKTSAAEANATATIMMDGHAGILERGFVWKLAGGAAPTVADNKVVEASTEMGQYTMSISGLVVGQSYQVRSYTNNEKGPAYGPVHTYTHR